MQLIRLPTGLSVLRFLPSLHREGQIYILYVYTLKYTRNIAKTVTVVTTVIFIKIYSTCGFTKFRIYFPHIFKLVMGIWA